MVPCRSGSRAAQWTYPSAADRRGSQQPAAVPPIRHGPRERRCAPRDLPQRVHHLGGPLCLQQASSARGLRPAGEAGTQQEISRRLGGRHCAQKDSRTTGRPLAPRTGLGLRPRGNSAGQAAHPGVRNGQAVSRTVLKGTHGSRRRDRTEEVGTPASRWSTAHSSESPSPRPVPAVGNDQARLVKSAREMTWSQRSGWLDMGRRIPSTTSRAGFEGQPQAGLQRPVRASTGSADNGGKSEWDDLI